MIDNECDDSKNDMKYLLRNKESLQRLNENEIDDYSTN